MTRYPPARSMRAAVAVQEGDTMHKSMADAALTYIRAASRLEERGASQVKVVQLRGNVFELTATGQELSALIAAGRLAADAMRSDPTAPREALGLLERVLRDYDQALARLRNEDGRARRPS